MTEKTQSWHQNAAFKTPNDADWRASVDKILAGADFNKTLVSKTLDGIDIQPLYQQLPNAPFIGRGKEPWAIQQSYDQGSIEDANKRILSDLANGLTCVELNLNNTKKSNALACLTATDLEQLLTDVHPQMIGLSLTPGSDNQLTSALLLSYYYRQKIAPEDVRCALNIDPLTTQASTGRCSKSALANLAQFATYCDNQYPNATSVGIDSSVYHNAGCTDAQELAFILATQVEYLRALQSLDADTAARQLRFRIALDSDFFMSVAKLRAARELINQVAQQCGTTESHCLIDAVSGSRSLTTLDSSVNILRISTQTAAAMAGGANAFICTPHDNLTDNSDKAQRLARNTQHILIEESGLLNIDDPTRGSGYVEALTKELCESAWQLFQTIESDGGMQQALEKGTIEKQISQSRGMRIEAMSNGKSAMIGVTDFPSLDETPIKAVDDLSETAAAHKSDGSNSSVSVTALISALSEGESTLDHQSYCNSRISSKALQSYRDAELFEKLRLRSNGYKNTNGNPPTVMLLALGSRKDYAARTGFCKNFFAIAGIDTNIVELADHNDTQSDLTVLCSTDSEYIEQTNKLSSLGKNKNLWVAGNNKQALAALKDCGITESIHLRSDKLALLDKALTLLGVPE